MEDTMGAGSCLSSSFNGGAALPSLSTTLCGPQRFLAFKGEEDETRFQLDNTRRLGPKLAEWKTAEMVHSLAQLKTIAVESYTLQSNLPLDEMVPRLLPIGILRPKTDQWFDN